MNLDLNDLVMHADMFVKDHTFVILACMTGLIALYAYYIGSPRRLERAMAKRKEREDVAQIISDAMQDAVHQRKISAKVFYKYQKKLGKAMELPNLVPMRATSRWPTNFHWVNLKETKVRCLQRLGAMGVNIVHGLDKIRSKRGKTRPQGKRKSA